MATSYLLSLKAWLILSCGLALPLKDAGRWMRNDFRCVAVMPTRTPLEVRHEVALELLGRGELDPYEALMLVCWPPKGSRLESVPTERRYYSEELKAEIRERSRGGRIAP
jgi:hypothetical protein